MGCSLSKQDNIFNKVSTQKTLNNCNNKEENNNLSDFCANITSKEEINEIIEENKKQNIYKKHQEIREEEEIQEKNIQKLNEETKTEIDHEQDKISAICSSSVSPYPFNVKLQLVAPSENLSSILIKDDSTCTDITNSKDHTYRSLISQNDSFEKIDVKKEFISDPHDSKIQRNDDNKFNKEEKEDDDVVKQNEETLKEKNKLNLKDEEMEQNIVTNEVTEEEKKYKNNCKENNEENDKKCKNLEGNEKYTTKKDKKHNKKLSLLFFLDPLKNKRNESKNKSKECKEAKFQNKKCDESISEENISIFKSCGSNENFSNLCLIENEVSSKKNRAANSHSSILNMLNLNYNNSNKHNNNIEKIQKNQNIGNKELIEIFLENKNTLKQRENDNKKNCDKINTTEKNLDEVIKYSSIEELTAIWILQNAKIEKDEKAKCEFLKKLEILLVALNPLQPEHHLRRSLLECGIIELCLKCLSTEKENIEICISCLAILIHMSMNDDTTARFTCLKGMKVVMDVFNYFYEILKKEQNDHDGKEENLCKISKDENDIITINNTQTKPEMILQNNMLYVYINIKVEVLILIWRLVFATISDGQIYAREWIKCNATRWLIETLKLMNPMFHNHLYQAWILGAIRLIIRSDTKISSKLVKQGLLEKTYAKLKAFSFDPLLVENAFAVLANAQQHFKKHTLRLNEIPNIWENLMQILLEETMITKEDVIYQGLFAFGIALSHCAFLQRRITEAGGLTLCQKVLKIHLNDFDIRQFSISLQTMLMLDTNNKEETDYNDVGIDIDKQMNNSDFSLNSTYYDNHNGNDFYMNTIDTDNNNIQISDNTSETKQNFVSCSSLYEKNVDEGQNNVLLKEEINEQRDHDRSAVIDAILCPGELCTTKIPNFFWRRLNDFSIKKNKGNLVNNNLEKQLNKTNVNFPLNSPRCIERIEEFVLDKKNNYNENEKKTRIRIMIVSLIKKIIAKQEQKSTKTNVIIKTEDEIENIVNNKEIEEEIEVGNVNNSVKCIIDADHNKKKYEESHKEYEKKDFIETNDEKKKKNKKIENEDYDDENGNDNNLSKNLKITKEIEENIIPAEINFSFLSFDENDKVDDSSNSSVISIIKSSSDNQIDIHDAKSNDQLANKNAGERKKKEVHFPLFLQNGTWNHTKSYVQNHIILIDDTCSKNHNSCNSLDNNMQSNKKIEANNLVTATNTYCKEQEAKGENIEFFKDEKILVSALNEKNSECFTIDTCTENNNENSSAHKEIEIDEKEKYVCENKCEESKKKQEENSVGVNVNKVRKDEKEREITNKKEDIKENLLETSYYDSIEYSDNDEENKEKNKLTKEEGIEEKRFENGSFEKQKESDNDNRKNIDLPTTIKVINRIDNKNKKISTLAASDGFNTSPTTLLVTPSSESLIHMSSISSSTSKISLGYQNDEEDSECSSQCTKATIKNNNTVLKDFNGENNNETLKQCIDLNINVETNVDSAKKKNTSHDEFSTDVTDFNNNSEKKKDNFAVAIKNDKRSEKKKKKNSLNDSYNKISLIASKKNKNENVLS